MLELYLLHPAAVHFPVALLSVGLTLGWLSRLRPGSGWILESASWLLWLGTVSAWAALGLGLLAEETAPHVPSAWETLADHETLAWWTAALFTGLSAWRLRGARALPAWLTRRVPAPGPDRNLGLAFLACWTLAAGVLFSTAYHGGELVFKFGMGVAR